MIYYILWFQNQLYQKKKRILIMWKGCIQKRKRSLFQKRQNKHRSNKNLKTDIIHNDVFTDEEIPQLSDTIGIESCMKDAIGYFKRNCSNWCSKTCISNDPNKKTFFPYVCVVCDCFMIGTEEIKWISTQDLKSQKKIGSEELENFIGYPLPLLLKNQ